MQFVFCHVPFYILSVFHFIFEMCFKAVCTKWKTYENNKNVIHRSDNFRSENRFCEIKGFSWMDLIEANRHDGGKMKELCNKSMKII